MIYPNLCSSPGSPISPGVYSMGFFQPGSWTDQTLLSSSPGLWSCNLPGSLLSRVILNYFKSILPIHLRLFKKASTINIKWLGTTSTKKVALEMKTKDNKNKSFTTTSQSLSLNLFQKGAPISLVSMIFQTCPYYLTYSNNIHELVCLCQRHLKAATQDYSFPRTLQLTGDKNRNTQKAASDKFLPLSSCAHQGC